ncbi:hypothetical protein [Cellulomonas iranensis]|uniref:hypothetical protein n=1 Tax=Cellulomonas iranensis TaxID=76862 RepID=UPI003D7C6871
MKLVDWNEALLSDLGERARPERRLYLYVDRETLADVSGLDEQAALDDFCAAFRGARGAQPFALGASAARRWAARGFDGEPPFVADLAMTVLAVTEEPVGASHGLYRTQNSLLGLPAEAIAPAGYGDDVPAMWEVWNRWLEGPGRALGHPSAKTHPVRTLQGWSLSQGLVRHRDRLTVEQFIQEFGPGAERVDVDELVLWLRYRGVASAGFLARVEQDAASREVVQDVLDDELARWRRDGLRGRDARTTRGLLHYDDWDDVLDGVVHTEASLVGQVVNVGHGETVTVDEHTPFLRVAVSGSPASWLQAGARHALTSTRCVSFGGATVFVFHDEPDVEGRLQSLRPSFFVPHHVLVHDSRQSDVVTALRHAGCDVEPRTALEGWSWLDDIVLTEDAPLLRVLGLSAAVPPKQAAVSLEGGMRLGRAQQYLCGQEPDVALPYQRARVAVDGNVVEATHTSTSMVRLAHLGLPPGEHVVEHGDDVLSFRSVAYVKDRAEHGDVERPGSLAEAGRWIFDDARQPSEKGTRLAGACVLGSEVREPALLHRPGSEYLVLCEDGAVHQVEPLRPRWLSRHGLEANGLDVDALASRVRGAALVLARNPRTREVLAVRCEDAPEDGASIPLVPRPDMVVSLVSSRPQWKWVGVPADGLARDLLSRAVQRGTPRPPTTRKPSATANNPLRSGAIQRSLDKPVAAKVLQRAGVVRGSLDNPYDEALTWLSERENASCTRHDFMRVWTWVCDKLDRRDLAGEWRQALQVLTDLGHVEQDFARSRVAVAPAAVVTLPEANGLHLLTGARPARLLERLDDPDDADPVVAEGVVLTSLEVRTPVDRAGRPVAPTAVYVEMEPRHASTVRSAYDRLGVRRHGCTSQWLLDTLPSVGTSVRDGTRFSHEPGSDPHVYVRLRDIWQWHRAPGTEGVGFYRFRQRHRKVFAWRPQPGADLVEVEPAVGRWLARGSVEHRPLVHDLLAKRLLVAQEMPLPEILRRALTLRTGMPAYVATCTYASGAPCPTMRAYENVSTPVAERVAAVLGAELHTEYSDMKDL